MCELVIRVDQMEWELILKVPPTTYWLMTPSSCTDCCISSKWLSHVRMQPVAVVTLPVGGSCTHALPGGSISDILEISRCAAVANTEFIDRKSRLLQQDYVSYV